MDWLTALLLGILQGLTEFLPVSSSGHLEIGKALLGVDAEHSLIFTVVVHGATVLSTIVVFYKDIIELFRGLFRFRWNEETQYISKLIASAIPVAIAGVFFREEIESYFNGNMVFVGSMLLLTAALLSFSYYKKNGNRKTNFIDSIVIGIAQALAVLPGISRSGATISTGLILGNKKETIAKFSFLMVLLPIIAANFLDLTSGEVSTNATISPQALAIGFFSAFISGLLACKWMIGIVKKGKLIYFAIYCAVIGLIAIFAG